MTVHKLSAGDGYTYLTRQVASADERRAPGQSLADYYTARGNPPGEWLGGGARALGVHGAVVTEAQMKALFGEGHHPNRDVLRAAGASERATRLGAAYLRLGGSDRRRPVAGYDLVFTPVKSASLLWALGGQEVRTQVEAAHHEALENTLRWIEQHAAFTRTGHCGAAQVDTTGLVAAAFDHRESRSGDPDLHTHVAVANKVCGTDGRWRSLDARVLHALGVAASERYNTRFEDALAARLGVQFADRPMADPTKRPVREIVGVPAPLIKHFSKRRAAIEDRYAELLADYRSTHGKEAARSTQLRLAQRATLETREGKAPGRTLSEQVAGWTDEATAVLGRTGLQRMLGETLGQRALVSELDEQQATALARQVVLAVSHERSTWSRWNLHAETERLLRGLRFPDRQAREAATDRVIAAATGEQLSIHIAEPQLVAEPDALRRTSDGQSVFTVHGGERYTTSAILEAEDSLLASALTRADAVDPLVVEAALLLHESASQVRLDSGQRRLVEFFAGYPARLSVGIGAAGSGKTTAMRAYAAVLAADGRRLIPLASSARAAQVLGDELGMRAENVHKFLRESQNDRSQDPSADPWFELRTGDVVLVDEAGMAGTLHLAEINALAAHAGAAVRLLGDPAQLSAVAAGGALRLLEGEVGAVRLDHLHRFLDPEEAAATLLLRDGDASAVDFYLTRDRVRSGSRDAMLEAAYDAWASDVCKGQTSLLVAVTSTDVAALNARARTERVRAGQVEPEGVLLRDDNCAGIGDWVVTRSNLRTLTCHRDRDWVKNGDAWQVTARHQDGSLSVRHLDHHGTVRLPAPYVAASVELGYASTAHRAQGTTVDTAHTLVSTETTREALYVASTRARRCTTWYAATEELLEATDDRHPDPPLTAVDLLAAAVGRSGAEQSATATIQQTQADVTRLPSLIARYTHAWELAAVATLRFIAPQAVEPSLARRLLNDPGHRQLATVLARSAARGAEPRKVLADAVAFDDLTGSRSPALVLATRVDDYPSALGIPRSDPDRPLPWLESPDVGHPGWAGYLRQRANLIRSRVDGLGSLTAAYREQYRLTHLRDDDLGDAPPEGTRRYAAYLAANEDLARRMVANPVQATDRSSDGRPPASRHRSRRPSQAPLVPVRRHEGDTWSAHRDF